MTTLKSQLFPIAILPGVQPSTDKTALATPHFTMADKIRFRFGYPQKIGGWKSVIFNYGLTINGVARSLFSAVLATAINTVIGTNLKFYSLSGSALTNITPLLTGTTPVADSLATDYGTLGSNPVATVNHSNVVTITDSNASKYAPGDVVTLSGATAFNGLSTGNLNSAHVVHTIVNATHYTLILGASATATGSGAGASVVRATGRITISATAHGMPNGNRVKIAGAADTGGIPATGDINAEFIIRNVAANSFDIMTVGTATSSVSGGGGAGTAFQPEIPVGLVNESLGTGYGMGLYGVGLYGTALQSASSRSYPRIWFSDRFGSSLVMTPGNQGGLYSWAGANTAAPALVTNAPEAINYAFVSNNIVVTFGAGNTPNRIFASDQGDMTQWTGSSSNQVFDDTVVGAGRFKSHVPVGGGNLIFTDYQTYLFSYIGLPGVWSIQQIENNIGLIGPMARVAVAGVAYWMGQNNFYMWAGANVSIIPANSQEQSTILNYVFSNINKAQASKCFAWYNEQFDEIWFHYPSMNSNECDRVARFNRTDLTWTPDTFDRTCAEYPNLTLGFPRLTSSASVLYAHEQGADADGQPMTWNVASNLRSGSGVAGNTARVAARPTSLLTGFMPDSVQSGNINVEVIARNFPQSATPSYDENYTVTPETEFVSTEIGGRFWQYKLSGNSAGQQWSGGQWHEFVQQGAPN